MVYGVMNLFFVKGEYDQLSIEIFELKKRMAQREEERKKRREKKREKEKGGEKKKDGKKRKKGGKIVYTIMKR